MLRYAHAFVPRDGGRAAGVFLGQGTVTGHYKSSLDILGVQYSQAF